MRSSRVAVSRRGAALWLVAPVVAAACAGCAGESTGPAGGREERVTLKATNADQLRDDTGTFIAEPDARDHLVKPPVESPTVAFGALAVLVLLVAWRKRPRSPALA